MHAPPAMHACMHAMRLQPSLAPMQTRPVIGACMARMGMLGARLHFSSQASVALEERSPSMRVPMDECGSSGGTTLPAPLHSMRGAKHSGTATSAGNGVGDDACGARGTSCGDEPTMASDSVSDEDLLELIE